MQALIWQDDPIGAEFTCMLGQDESQPHKQLVCFTMLEELYHDLNWNTERMLHSLAPSGQACLALGSQVGALHKKCIKSDAEEIWQCSEDSMRRLRETVEQTGPL